MTVNYEIGKPRNDRRMRITLLLCIGKTKKRVKTDLSCTQADLDKCPSDLKRLAMAKSRLAHKLGYKVLEVFSDIKVDKDPDGPGDRYRVEFLIQEKK